jgi:hypothetical protein
MQTAWYLDYNSGNDEYDGTQSTHGAGLIGPLKTRGELYRRLGRGGDWLLDFPVTITVTGSRSATDYISGFELNLGPSGSWTESGISAEAFSIPISSVGRYAFLARGGIWQSTPTTSTVNSAEGRSQTRVFLVDFDTSDATPTTLWTYTPPANSNVTVAVSIAEKKVATGYAEAITAIDSFVRDGTGNVARIGSATQENFAARGSALSTATYALGTATTTITLSATNVAATSVRGTATIVVTVNPD